MATCSSRMPTCVETNCRRSQTLCALGLPESMFHGVPARFVTHYRQRAGSEPPRELRRHSPEMRYTLLAVIVVVQIFISKRYPIYSLRYQLIYRMLDCPRVSIVGEAFRESPDDPSSLFYFSQQQSTAFGGDPAIGEVRYHRTSQSLKLIIFEVTLCAQEAVPFFRSKLF